MAKLTRWEMIGEQNPDRSLWYIERFKVMAEQGADLAGEARLIDAMVPRGSRILDAGSGPGRVGGELADRGHVVVGVDIDPMLIEEAKAVHPNAQWFVGSLEDFDLPSQGVNEKFDIAVCAGNVMTFLAPETETSVLRRIADHLTPEGRIVVGFGAGRGLEFDDFLADARDAGLTIDATYSTWDLRPLAENSDFLVAVLSLARV